MKEKIVNGTGTVDRIIGEENVLVRPQVLGIRAW